MSALQKESESLNSLVALSKFQRRVACGDDLQELLSFLITGLLAHRKATSAMLIRLVDDSALDILISHGLRRDEIDALKAERITPSHPVARAIKSQETVIFSTERIVSKLRANRDGATIYLPLLERRLCKTSLVIGFEEMWDLLEAESAFLSAIAESIALRLQVETNLPPKPENRESLSRKDSLEALELSKRQYQIAQMIAEGMTNTAIARRLGFSEATIRYETIKLYERLRVKNRAHAAARIRDLLR